MDDIFDQDEPPEEPLDGPPNGPPGGMHSGGWPFRNRGELDAENKRLREDLLRLREENELMAELLAGRFEKGSGEVRGGAEEGEDLIETRPRFAISDAAIDLFEALPEAFTLDVALDRAERLEQPSAETARHLRTYLGERMVVQEEGRFTKTGGSPTSDSGGPPHTPPQ